MESFLKEKLQCSRQSIQVREKGKVIDCLTASNSSVFYDHLFSANRSIEKPELYDKVKGQIKDATYVDPAWRQIVSKLKAMLPHDAFVVELGGGVHQRRSGFLYRDFPRYVPLDISLSSIERYAQTYKRSGIVCDATT